MMSAVCSKESCNMCGACMAICPKKCIEGKRDGQLWYADSDENTCVNCGLCKKVCSNITTPDWKKSECVYAAWDNNAEERKESASGGIAAAMYRYAIKKGMYIVGVELDDNYEAHFKMSNDAKSILKFRNSKYTYSYMGDVYTRIEEVLRKNKGIVFVGLPCQVAGLQNYLDAKKLSQDKLITIDLICHGTPLPEYLSEHIQAIGKKYGKEPRECSFREVKCGTENFVFSLKDSSGKLFYKKIVESDDLYQIGYHRGWIYRENCYHCQFAQKQRCGDFTIGDYSGLGKVESFNKPKDKVSSFFINTEKGKAFLQEMQKDNVFYLEERNMLEPYTYDPQLSHPSKEKDSIERRAFINYGGGTRILLREHSLLYRLKIA